MYFLWKSLLIYKIVAVKQSSEQSLDWITLNSEREIYKEHDHRMVLTTLIIIKITVIITIKMWMGEEAEHNTNTNNNIQNNCIFV